MRGLAEAAPDDLVLISDAMKSPNPLTWSGCVTVFESEAYLHDLNAESRLPRIVQSPQLLARHYLRDPQAVRSLRPRVSKSLLGTRA